MCFRMFEYQQQIASLEGDCRDLRANLQVGNELYSLYVGCQDDCQLSLTLNTKPWEEQLIQLW